MRDTYATHGQEALSNPSFVLFRVHGGWIGYKQQQGLQVCSIKAQRMYEVYA